MAYVGRFDGSEAKHASPAMAAQSGNVGCNDLDPSALPTSTKWSVLSSRVEGLVAELSQVVGHQDAYCVAQSKAEGPVMVAIREKMLSTPWGEEWEKRRTMFSYGEEMSTDPLEAMMLKQFAFMMQPRRILEIGMFAGYGSAAMLEGAPNTHVVSLDIDPYLQDWVGSCLAGFPDCAKRHEVVVGPALDSLKVVSGEFDMIFVDANKAEYKAYVETIMERKLLSRSGILVCDNVLYNGYPYVHEHFDAQPRRRDFGNAIRDFNQWICDHPDLEQVVLPIRDGVSLVRQKPAAAPLGRPLGSPSVSFVPGVTDYYTFPPAPYSLMVDIALREKGITTEAIAAHERFIDLPALENRCDEILKMNPHGTVPFFKMDDGSFINETLAMTEYLDEVVPGTSSLVGRTAKERAAIRMWQGRMEEHYIIPAFYGHRNWTSSSSCAEDHFMRGFFSKRLTPDHGSCMIPEAWKQWCDWAKNRMVWLDQQKQKEAVANDGKSTDFIAGSFISTVDIRVYVCLWFFSEAFPYPPQMILQDLAGQIPWVQAWYDRVHSRPAVAAAREYREKSLAAYEARKETGERAPNAALP